MSSIDELLSGQPVMEAEAKSKLSLPTLARHDQRARIALPILYIGSDLLRGRIGLGRRSAPKNLRPNPGATCFANDMRVPFCRSQSIFRSLGNVPVSEQLATSVMGKLTISPMTFGRLWPIAGVRIRINWKNQLGLSNC